VVRPGLGRLQGPRFPADEALKLARVAGLDFDRQVKKVVCEIKNVDNEIDED